MNFYLDEFQKINIGFKYKQIDLQMYKIYNITSLRIVYMYYIDWFLLMVRGTTDTIARARYEQSRLWTPPAPRRCCCPLSTMSSDAALTKHAGPIVPLRPGGLLYAYWYLLKSSSITYFCLSNKIALTTTFIHSNTFMYHPQLNSTPYVILINGNRINQVKVRGKREVPLNNIQFFVTIDFT